MIEYAGHGVAMKNGIDELKNIANAITPFTNDENGFGEVFTGLLPASRIKSKCIKQDVRQKDRS